MSSRKIRVLYCEDHEDTRELMRLVFENAGFEVACPADPRDCLRLAKEQQFDAYVLDNRMPALSGTGICEEIRKFDSDTPVIFLSGAAYQTDKEKALAAGAQFYITKPADLETVVQIIHSAIAGNHQTE